MRRRIKGIIMAYTDRGHGPPVVLLHAFPLNRQMWAPQVRVLAREFRVIAPDLRGHGRTTATDGVYTMDLLADDVRALLDTLGIQEFVLGGLSMGGYVALAFYRQWPERVRGLLLCDTRADADTPERRRSREELSQRAIDEGIEAVASAMLPRLLAPDTLSRRPALVERVRRLILQTPVRGVVGALAGMAQRPDSTDLLPRIACPTLVVTGEDDAVSPPEVARTMCQLIPRCQTVIIEGAGHLPNLERPRAFNRVVRQFLRQTTGLAALAG